MKVEEAGTALKESGLAPENCLTACSSSMSWLVFLLYNADSLSTMPAAAFVSSVVSSRKSQ